MIAKIIKGKGFRGALSYLMRAGCSTLIGGNMAGSTPRELAAEFGQFRKLRPRLTKAVVHIPLSAHPQDRQLSDTELAAIAEELAVELGYAESPHVVIRHNDTAHQHAHLLLCRIDRDGKAVSDSNDFRRAELALRRIERTYGLRQLAPEPTANAPTTTTSTKTTTEEEQMNDQNDLQPVGLQAPTPDLAIDAEANEDITMALQELERKDLTAKRNREALRKVLSTEYEAQLRTLWGDTFRLYKHPRGVTLYFDDKKQVRDEGRRVTAKGMAPAEAARMLVAIAKLKGWTAVEFSGGPDFLREAMRLALLSGLQVVPKDAMQLTMLNRIKAELSAPTEPESPTETPPSLKDKLLQRRERLAQHQAPADERTQHPSRGPRHP